MYMTRGDAEELFRFKHLPEHLAKISERYYNTAMRICDEYVADAKRTELLNKLWEVKNIEVWMASNAGVSK